MAFKYIKLKAPLSSIEAGILKKIGLNVINEKLFIDEKILNADLSSNGRKSKRKGGTFERKIATALSMWWSDGKEKDEFSKTPRSGAWKFPQDLVPPVHCPFLISCKNEESWLGIEKTLTTKHRFQAYWKELEESIAEMSRTQFKLSLFEMTTLTSFHKIIPMVIFTRNNETDYLMIKEVHFNRMQGFCSNFPKSKKLVTFTDVKNPFNENPETASSHERIAYTVMTLSDFIDWMEPDSIKSYVDENESKQTSEIKQQSQSPELQRSVPLL